MGSIKLLSIEMFMEDDGIRFKCLTNKFFKCDIDLDFITEYIMEHVEDIDGKQFEENSVNVA